MQTKLKKNVHYSTHNACTYENVKALIFILRFFNSNVILTINTNNICGIYKRIFCYLCNSDGNSKGNVFVEEYVH